MNMTRTWPNYASGKPKTSSHPVSFLRLGKLIGRWSLHWLPRRGELSAKKRTEGSTAGNVTLNLSPGLPRSGWKKSRTTPQQPPPQSRPPISPGTYGTLPACAGDVRCGSNRVHKAIHVMPATPIASHQTTTGNRPNSPTDNPIGIKAVTSPNPNDRGTSNANANWIRQHSTVNNSACNSTNRSFTTTPYANRRPAEATRPRHPRDAPADDEHPQWTCKPT